MKVIYNPFLPFPGFTAMNLCGLILARRESEPLQAVTLRHEAIHTAQMRETLYVGFYLLYLLEWFIKLFVYGREAYRHISFEREAYQFAPYENYLEERKAYAWLRFIIHHS